MFTTEITNGRTAPPGRVKQEAGGMLKKQETVAIALLKHSKRENNCVVLARCSYFCLLELTSCVIINTSGEFRNDYFFL